MFHRYFEKCGQDSVSRVYLPMTRFPVFVYGEITVITVTFNTLALVKIKF